MDSFVETRRTDWCRKTDSFGFQYLKFEAFILTLQLSSAGLWLYVWWAGGGTWAFAGQICIFPVLRFSSARSCLGL